MKVELFFATASLLLVTTVASYIYYKRIRQAQEEYEGSKDLVRVITSGFRREVDKIAKSISGLREDASAAQYAASESLKASRDAVELVRMGVEESNGQSERLEEAEKTIQQLRAEVEQLSQRPVVAVQPPSAAVQAPIPVQGDAVLDGLTPTELNVLALIEEMGEGTVPDIRERIGKTREHTARLLKKLYDRGFIDRNTSSMPYRYYVRKEIRELIKQQKDGARISA
jgi:hypothetical protein